MSIRAVNDDEHQRVWSQIPWYVNETLADAERSRVESHLAGCAACSAEASQQRSIQRAMTGDSGVDHISSGSLNRLRQRLDEASRLAPVRTSAAVPHFLTRRRSLLAASVMIFAAVIGAAGYVAHRPDASAAFPDKYYTVSSPQARVPQEIIRAVFAPSITLAQLQAVLDESHLKIVAGPTEAGVYSLSATEGKPVGELLANLRRHPTVRFAEATGP